MITEHTLVVSTHNIGIAIKKKFWIYIWIIVRLLTLSVQLTSLMAHVMEILKAIPNMLTRVSRIQNSELSKEAFMYLIYIPSMRTYSKNKSNFSKRMHKNDILHIG